LSAVIRAVLTVLELNGGYNNVPIDIYVGLGRQHSCLYSRVLVSCLIAVDFNNLWASPVLTD